MANLSNINNKFLVTTGGNVLIGQTAAVGSSILQVTGNSTFAGDVGIGAAATDGNLHIRKTGVNTGITNVLMNANFADASNGTGLSIGYRTDETTAVIAPRTSTGNLAFYSYNGGWSESMRIKNDGNVGIGTNDPNALLSLGPTGGQKLYVYESGVIRSGFGIDLSGSSRELSIFTTSSNGTTGNISFGYRLESTGVYQEKMQLSSSGELNVKGNLTLSVASSFINTAAGDLYINPASNNTTLYDGTNAQILNVYNAGNLAIKLDSVAGTYGGVILSQAGLNFVHGYSGYGLVLSHYNVGGSNAIVSGDASNPDNLYINNGGANDWSNVIISGNVGIGTDSPDSKLHVDSGVSSTSDWGNLGIISDFPINNAGRIYTSYLLQDSESIKGAGIGLAYDGTGYKMHFGTASTTSSGLSTQMTIDRLGNVGIGTASLFSGAKLDVYGDLVLGQQNWAIRGNNANADIGFEELAGGSFSDANLRLYLQSGGNVGIGTTSPDYKLEVESTSDADLISIKSTAIANNTQMRLGISGNDSVISGTGGSTGSLVFKTYGTERMRIDSNGWVSVVTKPNSGLNYDVAIWVGNVLGYQTTLQLSNILAYNANYLSSYNGITFADGQEATTSGGTVIPAPGRSTSPAPQDYQRSFSTEFKLKSASGSPGITGSWAGLISMAPYNPTTSGFYTTQIAFGGDGAGDGIFTRRGSQTTWGAWREFIIKDTSGNISPNGVYLGGTSSTNLLNHYEQGTYSPILRSISGSTATMGLQNGYWTRIGNVVTVGGTLTWSANGSNANSYTVITMPFSNTGATNARVAGTFGAVNGIALGDTLRLVLDPGQNQAYVIQQNSNNYSHTNTIAASGAIYGFSITYRLT